jgi:DNA-binding LytR/AlgR family response regulator
MRVLIADDEPIALERLQLALTCVPEAELVAAARNGRQAAELIRELKPDVAVLDVQMPGRDGFEVIEALGDAAFVPEVIFVTAFDEHAIRAFDVHAVDYLLKPVAFERFREALRRAGARLEARASDARFSELQRLLDAVRAEGRAEGEAFERELWVPSRQGLTRLAVADIDLIEAEGDYVRLHVGTSSHLYKDTLSGLCDRLDPTRFLRVHRSAAVSLERIAAVRRRLPRGLVLTLAGGRQVPVGPSYTAEVLERTRARRWRGG